jgi:hypothetical protein
MIEIYLYTKSSEKDYQWFSVNKDDSVSVAENFWETNETLKKAPISEDEFSLVMGKDKELFLLASDLDSGRIDFKETPIKNSFLIISDDEVLLRKITTSFIFNHGDIAYDLNSKISQDEDGNLLVKYSEIEEVLSPYLNLYEVVFEFDAIIDHIDQRFAELFLKKEIPNEETEYLINPIFEEKVKKYLLAEIFPEEIPLLFLYTSKLSLGAIKRTEVHVSLAKELDTVAKGIFLKNPEDWAEITVKGKQFNSTVKSLGKRSKSEWLLLLAAGIIVVPITYSYIDLSSKVDGYLQREIELKKEIISLESDKSLKLDAIKQVENEKRILKDKVTELESILESDQKTIITLEKRIRELSQQDREKIEVVATKTIQIQPDKNLKKNLQQCQRKYNREKKQRDKLSIGYKWYKDLYENCKTQLQ